MSFLAYDFLNTFIVRLHEYLEKNYMELIDFCYKLNNFDELKDVLKNISIEMKYEYELLVYVLDGEIPDHPIFYKRIEILGLYCIKNSMIKSREYLKKEVTFDDLYNLIKIKNKTISFLRQRVEMPKLSLELVESIKNSNPATTTPITSPIASPTLLPGVPQNFYDYNPFVKNVWK
jgi:hypothetical protein